jgi:hypothetical protein
MPQYPVLQPDGQVAVWSTVVDHFIALNCTVGEAVDILTERYPDRVKNGLIVQNLVDGIPAFDWWMSWPECLAWAIFRFGEDDEAVMDALAVSPDQTAARAYLAKLQADQLEEEARDAREQMARSP